MANCLKIYCSSYNMDPFWRIEIFSYILISLFFFFPCFPPNISGTIYEGTSNIQLNTIAKCIKEEKMRGLWWLVTMEIWQHHCIKILVWASWVRGIRDRANEGFHHLWTVWTERPHGNVISYFKPVLVPGFVQIKFKTTLYWIWGSIFHHMCRYVFLSLLNSLLIFTAKKIINSHAWN